MQTVPHVAHARADARIAELREACCAQATPPALPPLLGVPVAIKDAFATQNMPTCWGTPIRAGQMLPYDAASVRSLRCAGAVILGKSALTEYCSGGAPATRNPRALAMQQTHQEQQTPLPGQALDVTPGGSSSGSAAAVAAGFAPVATGTQTLGSTIRPAAFCGIYGFKPAFGNVGTGGVVPVATALDHVGFFARSVPDLRMVLHAHAQPHSGAGARAVAAAAKAASRAQRCAHPAGLRAGRAPRFVVPVSAQWAHAEQHALDRLWEVAEALCEAGATVRKTHLPACFNDYHVHAQVRSAVRASADQSTCCFAAERSRHALPM